MCAYARMCDIIRNTVKNVNKGNDVMREKECIKNELGDELYGCCHLKSYDECVQMDYNYYYLNTLKSLFGSWVPIYCDSKTQLNYIYYQNQKFTLHDYIHNGIIKKDNRTVFEKCVHLLI